MIFGLDFRTLECVLDKCMVSRVLKLIVFLKPWAVSWCCPHPVDEHLCGLEHQAVLSWVEAAS